MGFAQFPLEPRPSSVSAPMVIDPSLMSTADQGYETRRPLRSRPYFAYTVEWLGKRTDQMRVIRDFLLQARLGALAFDWAHPLAVDTVTVLNTTPVVLTYQYGHGLVTGQSVGISNATPHVALNGIRSVQRLNNFELLLPGTTPGGQGTASVVVWLPNAVARFNQGRWASPVHHFPGPEQNNAGYFSWSLEIEEVP